MNNQFDHFGSKQDASTVTSRRTPGILRFAAVLIAFSAFGLATSFNAFSETLDFGEALNNTNLIWNSSGDQLWFPQTKNTHDGALALQSGGIVGSQQSTAATTVVGPGTLSFWWSVSSETNNDYASFAIDGTEQARVSGLLGKWRQLTFYVVSGTHSLAWTYAKNDTKDSGMDAVWLDEVSFIPGTTPAFVVSGPIAQSALIYSNATFAVTPGGTPPFNYQWLFNGAPIANATNSSLTISNVQMPNSGNYSVLLSNEWGSATSSNALLYVRNLLAWGAGTTNKGSVPNYGQSIVPTNLLSVKAIAGGGYHTLALCADGHVVGWGNDKYQQARLPPSDLTNASAITAGLYYSVALKSNGTPTVWGDFNYGLQSVPRSATNIMAIAAGAYHILALKSNGTVVAWGAGTSQGSQPNYGQCMVPTNLSGVAAIAVGAYHSLALMSNGTVAAWGLNSSGQTNVPAGLGNVVAIAAGGSNSLALTGNGTLVAWGYSGNGQTNIPPGLTNVADIRCGMGHNMALLKDGNLVCWGLNDNSQTNVPSNATNIVSISAGGYHSLALLNSDPLTFILQPRNQTIWKGSDVVIDAAVLGQGPISYQWQKNGTDLSGATNASLQITNVPFSASGSYQVVVSNAFTVATSSVALLVVNDTSPYFTLQPTNVALLPGSNLTLSAGVGGVPPIACQWFLNGSPIADATNAVFSVKNAQLTNQGIYSLLASNAYGFTVSSNVSVDIIDLPYALNLTNVAWSNPGATPWFAETTNTHDGIAAAQSGAISGSQTSTLQTTVTGPAMVVFWWKIESLGFWDILVFYANGTPLSSISDTSPFPHSEWLQVTNYIGSGTQVLQWNLSNRLAPASATAWIDQIQVIPVAGLPPTIASLTGDIATNAGNNVTLSLTAGGTTPFHYQWQFNGASIEGRTNNNITLNNVQATNAGVYSVVVTNDYGSATGSLNLVVSNCAPVITSQPSTQTGVVYTKATFTAGAKGSDPLSFQWYFNGSAIDGAVSSSLCVSNLQFSNGGDYYAVVSNDYGQATSAVARLTMVLSRVIDYVPGGAAPITQPADIGNVRAVAAGALNTLALRADGTVIAWGTNQFGQTNVPIGLSNVVAIAAGNTHCLALKNDGAVVAWGEYGRGQGGVPDGLSNIVAISAGPTYNLALKNDGTVVAWGDANCGQTNIPAGLTNVQAIFAGSSNAFAIKTDGFLVQWGSGPTWQHNGTNVQLTLSGSNLVGIAAAGFTGWTLQDNGVARAFGFYDGNAPFTNVYGSRATWNVGHTSPLIYSNIIAVTASGDGDPNDDYILVLDTSGKISGLSLFGLGLSRPGPNIDANPGNVVAIAANGPHAAALINDGSPRINWSPLSRIACTGDTVAFTASASGAQPLSYQWLFNGEEIESATNATLILTDVPLSAAGSYTCIVSNVVNTASTLSAKLTVLRTAPYLSVASSGFNPSIGFRYQLSGISGHGSVIVYASTNLANWVPILTNPPHLGSLEIVDPATTNNRASFYRVEEK